MRIMKVHRFEDRSHGRLLKGGKFYEVDLDKIRSQKEVVIDGEWGSQIVYKTRMGIWKSYELPFTKDQLEEMWSNNIRQTYIDP